AGCRIRDDQSSLGRCADRATIVGVNFDLTPEQQAIRDTCRDFAREVVAPAAEELDREHRFGYDVVRQMGELGLFGLPFPEEYGGAGGDFLSPCLAIEEISRADTESASRSRRPCAWELRPFMTSAPRSRK